MFALEFRGRGVKSLRFVTPDEDVTLEFHCHVATHEEMGMHGRLVVGKGGEPAVHEAPPAEAKRLYQGVGVIIAVLPRKSRIVVDHEEIKDFMAAMEMSYMVTPATLLERVKPGDKVRFTIDADERVIIDVAVE